MRRILIPVVAVALAASLTAQNMRAPQQVDMGLGKTFNGGLVADNGFQAVMYKEDLTFDIYVNTSVDGGLTWRGAVKVSQDTTGAKKYAYNYSLALSGGILHASYRSEQVSDRDDVFYTRSLDGGLTWEAEQMIDKGYPAANGANATYVARLMADGNDVYMYMLVDNGPEEVWLSASHDAGASWGPALQVTPVGGADVDKLAMTANGMDVYCAYDDDRNVSGDDELWFRMSHDGGATWMGPEVQLDASGPGVGDVDGGNLWMGCDGSTVMVSWLEDEVPTAAADEEMHVIVSTDGGHNWGADTVLMTGSDADNQWLNVVAGRLSVAWEDNATGADEMMVASSSDNGATWVTAQVSNGGAAYPRLVGSADTLAAAWGGMGAPEFPMAAMSQDGGATWSAQADMATGTQDAFDADYIEVAYDAVYNNVFGAWLSDDLGQNQQYVGGFRGASLNPMGTFAAGNPVHWEVAGYPVSEAGKNFVVIASGSVGVLPIPGDGRNLGVTYDAYVDATRGGMLMGAINADGTGSTGTIGWPGSVPVGSTVQFVAISLLGAGSYGSITDVMPVTVQ
ncbi:MAG: exo-alpha-sialidase [Planctomycetes bacterium]|nr:exo-alpha-sialidase [Planctomycetota bacterium]